MWRANGNPIPCTDLDEILHTHFYLSKGGFDAGLNPDPLSPWASGPETLEAEGHIIENCLQNKRCSAGCKLIRAAPGASASCFYKNFIKINQAP